MSMAATYPSGTTNAGCCCIKVCTTRVSWSEGAVLVEADLWPAGTCSSRKSPDCLAGSFQECLQVGLLAASLAMPVIIQ